MHAGGIASLKRNDIYLFVFISHTLSSVCVCACVCLRVCVCVCVQVVETTLRQAIPRTKVTPYTLTILPHETLTYTEQLTALYRTLPDMQHLQDRVSAIDLSGKWLWSAGLLQVLLEASETCRNIGVVFNGPLTYSTLKLFRAAHEQHRVFKTVHTQPLQLQLLSQPRPDNQPMWSLEAEHYLAYRSAVGPATQQQQQQQQQTRREPQLHKVAFTGVASEGRGQYISGLSMCEELGFSEPFVSEVQCKDLLALMDYGLRFQMLRCARATLPQCIAQVSVVCSTHTHRGRKGSRVRSVHARVRSVRLLCSVHASLACCAQHN